MYEVRRDSKDQLTFIVTMNRIIPWATICLPIVYPVHRTLSLVNYSAFAEPKYNITPSGWIDTHSFVRFLDFFIDSINAQNGQKLDIIFVDGHYISHNSVVLFS